MRSRNNLCVQVVLLALLACLVAPSCGQTGRAGRQQTGRTTVISCRSCATYIYVYILFTYIDKLFYSRVFRKGVCKKSKSNIILVNKSIASKFKESSCLCYSIVD